MELGTTCPKLVSQSVEHFLMWWMCQHFTFGTNFKGFAQFVIIRGLSSAWTSSCIASTTCWESPFSSQILTVRRLFIRHWLELAQYLTSLMLYALTHGQTHVQQASKVVLNSKTYPIIIMLTEWAAKVHFQFATHCDFMTNQLQLAWCFFLKRFLVFS